MRVLTFWVQNFRIRNDYIERERGSNKLVCMNEKMGVCESDPDMVCWLLAIEILSKRIRNSIKVNRRTRLTTWLQTWPPLLSNQKSQDCGGGHFEWRSTVNWIHNRLVKALQMKEELENNWLFLGNIRKRKNTRRDVLRQNRYEQHPTRPKMWENVSNLL